MAIWIIVGATKGIGLEFVKQLLERGDHVLATARTVTTASNLWQLAGGTYAGACRILQCDVTKDDSITTFTADIVAMHDVRRIDYVVLNAGMLKYPNRVTEISFNDFDEHLKTNTIGPCIVAQKLWKTRIPIGMMIFMSSSSGSATKCKAFEDGFAAYAASKAALNHLLRHMAAELQSHKSETSIIAMHPGVVATDPTNLVLQYGGVDGILKVEESVSAMLKVIDSKTIEDSGTFWTWEGEEHPW